jgi:protoporphyrinogen oxidase
MKHVKFLVLGAGPCGLSVAHQLLNMGEESFLVLEKEVEAGGLCRSSIVDGHPLDTGGGHFLDVRRQEVLEFLFRFMPREEWTEFRRVAKIRLRGLDVDHPLEANLWQLPKRDQVDFLASIAEAGCLRGSATPMSFAEWIPWKLGAKIAEEYMLPYNRKLWCMDLDRLGTYWLHKLPDVSFSEVLRSCLEGQPFGTLPAHGVFLYPKEHGYGEIWRRMGLQLGDRLITSCPVTSVDAEDRVVNGMFTATRIITTIPWTAWPDLCALPAGVLAATRRLVHTSLDVDYFPQDMSTPAHWIYEPDETISYHRILVRHNFCPKSRGYWTETNPRRLSKLNGLHFHNEFAYPVNTRDKPEAVAAVAAWAGSHGIVGAGRWGSWEHINSDVAVSEGIRTAIQVAEECNAVL